MLEGQGKFFFANGNRYEGGFRAGKREGQGKFFSAENERYEGEHRLDKREGQGKFFFANGDRYEGEFRAGKIEGQGELFFVNKDRYEGEFRAGMQEGQGTIFFASGASYKGVWANGKCESLFQDLIATRFKASNFPEDFVCGICFQGKELTIDVLKCPHCSKFLHSDCLKQWFHNNHSRMESMVSTCCQKSLFIL